MVYVPVNQKQAPTIREGETELVARGEVQADASKHIRYVRLGRDYYVFAVGAGGYRFEVR